MTTSELLCPNAPAATFAALHNGQYKIFETTNTPLRRADYPYRVVLDNSLVGSSSYQYDDLPAIVQCPANVVGCKLLNLEVYFAPFDVILNGQTIMVVSPGAPYAPVDFDDQLDIPPGATLYIHTPRGGTTPFATRWGVVGEVFGHRVTDTAGQVEIFRSGSPDAPATYDINCIGGCPPGTIRCGDCCLDCSDTANRIAAMGARL
jgi:hypothetical protein